MRVVVPESRIGVLISEGGVGPCKRADIVGPGGFVMPLCPYNSDELKQLHRVLEQLIAESQERALNVLVDDIIERMFDIADQGERDPAKLREAVLKRAA